MTEDLLNNSEEVPLLVAFEKVLLLQPPVALALQLPDHLCHLLITKLLKEAEDASRKKTLVWSIQYFVQWGIWETKNTNPNPLQHAAAGQLVEHQGWLNLTGLLVPVGDDTAGQVGLGCMQFHQLVQLLCVEA